VQTGSSLSTALSKHFTHAPSHLYPKHIQRHFKQNIQKLTYICSRTMKQHTDNGHSFSAILASNHSTLPSPALEGTGPD